MAGADEQQMLQKALADIQQPPLPDEFYFAPVYWLALLLLALLSIYCWRRYRARRLRDQSRQLALAEFDQLTTSAGANAVLLLLKQYLHARKPNHPALVMSATDFFAFLQQTVPPTTALPTADWLLYSGQADEAALQQWFDYARLWLASHPESALNV